MSKAANNLYDLDFSKGDLSLTASLLNSVLLSFGTWLRETSVGKAVIDPVMGGWFGNALESQPVGSFLWKNVSGKLDQANLDDAVSKAKEALKWMVDDGVADSVNVTAEISATAENTANFTVTLVKPDKSEETFEFQANWEATK